MKKMLYCLFSLLSIYSFSSLFSYVSAEDSPLDPIFLHAPPLGDGVTFNGSNQFGKADIDINSFSNPYLTIEAWVYPERQSYYRSQILSQDNGGYDRSLLIEWDSWSVFTGDYAWNAAPVDFNKWQHIAVVFTPDNIYFYKNGVKYEYGRPPSFLQGHTFITLGKNPDYGEYFKGSIGDVRIWNKKLTKEDLDKELTGNEPGLLAQWKLNERSGEIGKDSSPFNQDLALEGNPDWYYSNYINQKQDFLEYDTSEGDIVARTGDIDNLGFGWNDSYFNNKYEEDNGKSYNPLKSTVEYPSNHRFPWEPDPLDAPGTDRIMVPSSAEYYLYYYGQTGNKFYDGYTSETKRDDNRVQDITLNFPLNDLCYDSNGKKKDICVNNAELQLYVDDFQPGTVQSKFEATIDGKRFYNLEDIINNLNLTGPHGKLIKVAIPSNLLKELNDSELIINIDDKTTGIGDGYAIDFARIIVNPKETYAKDVVFIPGIMGTELYEIEEDGSKDVLWIPGLGDVTEIDKLFLNEDGIPIGSEMIKDGISIENPLTDREKLKDGTLINSKIKIGEPLEQYYKKVILKLRSEGYRVHTFGYDWRLDNSYNAKQLEKFVNGEETDSGKQIKKLNNFSIVAHSMGGLIASEFIEKDENFEKIDKLITAGTPYLGSPKSLWTLETGEITGEFKELFVQEDFRVLSSHSPSAYQLLPSFRYFNDSSSYYITTKNLEEDSIPHYLNGYNLTKDFLIKKRDLSDQNESPPKNEVIENADCFSDQNESPLRNKFIENADCFQINLNLSNIINSEKVYTLVGSDLNTLSNISYLYEGDRLLFKNMEEYLLGDGTVPLKSSTINGELDNNHNEVFYNIGHSELYNNDDVISKVKEILRSKNTPVIKNNSLTTELTSTEEWTSFTLANTSPEDVEITNREEIEKTGTIDIYPYVNDTIIHVSGKKLDFKLKNKQQIDMKIEHMNTKNKKVKTEKFKQTKIKKNNTFKFSKEKGITMQ